jgi:hypothetical protein
VWILSLFTTQCTFRFRNSFLFFFFAWPSPYVRFIYIIFSPRSSISMFLCIPNNFQLKLHCITCLHFAHFAQTLTMRSQEIQVTWSRVNFYGGNTYHCTNSVFTLLYWTIIRVGIYFILQTLIWWHVPLCMLLIKLPSDFSCGLKVSHKAFLTESNHESTIIIVPSHGQSRPVQFPSCDFDASLVLTADKATVRFHSGMKCHTKH